MPGQASKGSSTTSAWPIADVNGAARLGLTADDRERDGA